MMVLCTKQHLSNIWSSIYEKVKQQRGCFEKKWNRTSAWVFSYKFAAYFQNIFS